MPSLPGQETHRKASTSRYWAVIALLARGAAALQVPMAATQQTVSARAAAAATVAPTNELGALVFPGMLIADEEPPLSPTKAKIKAAKEAAAAKAAAGGYKAPETKTVAAELKFDDVQKDAFAEADELRAKIDALKASGVQSKSKSAQLASLRQMESNARERARRETARVEDKQARAVVREAEKSAAPGSSSTSSYSDSLKKVTGQSLPSLF